MTKNCKKSTQVWCTSHKAHNNQINYFSYSTDNYNHKADILTNQWILKKLEMTTDKALQFIIQP